MSTNAKRHYARMRLVVFLATALASSFQLFGNLALAQSASDVDVSAVESQDSKLKEDCGEVTSTNCERVTTPSASHFTELPAMIPNPNRGLDMPQQVMPVGANATIAPGYVAPTYAAPQLPPELLSTTPPAPKGGANTFTEWVRSWEREKGGKLDEKELDYLASIFKNKAIEVPLYGQGMSQAGVAAALRGFDLEYVRFREWYLNGATGAAANAKNDRQFDPTLRSEKNAAEEEMPNKGWVAGRLLSLLAIVLAACIILYGVHKAAHSSSADSAGFWRTLIRGDYGLAKTYWLYLIAGQLLLLIVIAGLIVADPALVGAPWFSVTVVVASLAYICPGLLGVWNAAHKYTGPTIWRRLAKFAVVLGAIGAVQAVVEMSQGQALPESISQSQRPSSQYINFQNDDAVEAAIATYRNSGVTGLETTSKSCWGGAQNHAKCITFDAAANRAMRQFGATPTDYFSEDAFFRRATPQFNADGFDQAKANEMLIRVDKLTGERLSRQ